MKNYWYLDNLPYLLQSSCVVPLPPSHIHCSSMLSTCPRCARDVWWLPTTSEVSRQLYGVARSNTYWHVAVDKGNLMMHGLDLSEWVKCVKNKMSVKMPRCNLYPDVTYTPGFTVEHMTYWPTFPHHQCSGTWHQYNHTSACFVY